VFVAGVFAFMTSFRPGRDHDSSWCGPDDNTLPVAMFLIYLWQALAGSDDRGRSRFVLIAFRGRARGADQASCLRRPQIPLDKTVSRK